VDLLAWPDLLAVGQSVAVRVRGGRVRPVRLDLGAVVDSLEAAGNDTELMRDVALDELDGEEHLALSRMLEDLTDRQREVLAMATGMGYYDEGSDVRVEDIADEMGLAGTTTWEHLSRAEEKVMAEVGEYLAARGH